jgi:hypothetical protein
MSAKDTKAVVRRYFEAVQQSDALVDELFSEDFAFRYADSPLPLGDAEMKHLLGVMVYDPPDLGRRLVLGMAAITAGSLVLSWVSRPELGVPWGALAIVGACLAWAIDNNLMRQVFAGDPLQIAGAKGLIAGLVNLIIAFTAGAHLPDLFTMLTAAVVGFLGYGVSVVLFVLALRHLGSAQK